VDERYSKLQLHLFFLKTEGVFDDFVEIVSESVEGFDPAAVWN
jgi:hypothetical protein